MRVSFLDRPFQGLFTDAVGAEKTLHGTLTTGHAASSYGMPVVVGEDGRVYGPADLPAGDCEIQPDGTSHQHADLIEAAVAAGFRVVPNCQRG